MTGEVKTVQDKKTGRGMKIALGLSLALNVAVFGVVAGAFLRDGGPGHGQMQELGLGPFTEAFSDADRRAMRESFMERRSDKGGIRAFRDAMRADRGAILAALRAEPFDLAALQATMAAQAARLTDQVALGQDLMAERIAAMTPEERRAFADRLEDMMDRGPDNDRMDGDGHKK